METVRRMRDPSKWDKARPSFVGGGDFERENGAAMSKKEKKQLGLPTWDDVSLNHLFDVALSNVLHPDLRR